MQDSSKILFGGIRHLRTVFWLSLMNILPVPSTLKWHFAKSAGVKFVVNKGEKPWFFIGDHVCFDKVYPQNIEIHNGVHITAGTTLLTHTIDTGNTDISDVYWKEGHIVIKNRAFIGINTIITNSVIIGEGSIIGSGSVVTKDVPDYEIWAGNPAKFLKKRKTINEED